MSAVRTPLILVNFKTYAEATGEAALKLANISQKVAREIGICIAVAPQPTDIEKVARRVSIPVLSQHIDSVPYGSYTGHILAEAVKKAGAVGTLMNHSERRLPLKTIESSLNRARNIGLISIVCADVPQTAASVATLHPDMIAIEPPELIGTGIPVSKALPGILTNTVTLVKEIDSRIIILCGAGITKGEDVTASVRLGMKGVLVASGVVKAKDPYVALLDLANSFQHS